MRSFWELLRVKLHVELTPHGVRNCYEATAIRWFAKFSDGEESFEDQPRAGRPREVDREAVLAAIEESPSLTTRMLADDFGCVHGTIENILHEAGKVWKKDAMGTARNECCSKKKPRRCCSTIARTTGDNTFSGALDYRR